MNERLVRSGVLLALLALLTGFAPMVVKNPRMALAAHVGGVTNALLLLALGAVWAMVKLPPKRGILATRLLVWGGYGNWAVVLLASITGAREFAPLVGAGPGASPAVEKATLLLIVMAGLASLAGVAMVLSGVAKRTSG
jgi:hydroxylaminobenzene mutase